MRFGDFLSPDCSDPADGGRVIDETLREARLADELGVEVIWLAENHFDGISVYGDPICKIRDGINRWMISRVQLHHYKHQQWVTMPLVMTMVAGLTVPAAQVTPGFA